MEYNIALNLLGEPVFKNCIAAIQVFVFSDQSK